MTDLPDFEPRTAADIISWAVHTYEKRFAIATSFQKEGLSMIDMAAQTGLPFRALTVDTGRLPDETLAMIEAVRERWGVEVEVVTPDPAEVAAMVGLHGPDLFHESVEMRQLCCKVRKVRPLERKLREFDAWASGLRRQHSRTRAEVPKVEFVDGRVKLNPLADWSSAELDAYVQRRGIPLHPFYSRGYASIGCAPCTRAIEPGEDERAGRWWWEEDAKKECGIHFTPDGKARRTVEHDA